MTDSLTALKLLTLGYPVIPSGGGPAGKSPLVEWAIYQHSFPDENDLIVWDEKFHPSLWGIVTGESAGVIIVDIDKPELKKIFDDCDLYPHIQTPRGGYHYWFRHPKHPVKTVAGLLPGVDIRGDGGFVNVIGKRSDGEYKVLFTPIPDSVYPWDKLPATIAEAIKAQGNGHKAETPNAPRTIVFEGEGRNHACTIEAGRLATIYKDAEIAKGFVRTYNQMVCKPPLDDQELESTTFKSLEKWVKIAKKDTGDNKSNLLVYPFPSQTESKRIKSVSKSVSKPPENVSSVSKEKIEEWVKDSTGWFSYEDVDKDFNIKTEDDKTRRRIIFKRLKADGIVEAHTKNNKLYRHVNVSVRLIDLKSGNKRTPVDIKYPLGIEKYFTTYPGNIIVLAGAADAGKTAFLLNVVKMNMYDFSIYYQSSEMGEAELSSRLEKFEAERPEDWNFTPEERSRDFADVIRPDCINIIDYMELSGDFYMLADYLRQIHDKLQTGIAIIALQKKRDVELGRGGDFGLEKPRLYLAMDKGIIKIQKAKNWANPECNPNGMILKFKLAAGCKFIVTEDWHNE